LWLPFNAIGALTSVHLAAPTWAQGQNTATIIVAAKVRSQGFICENPSSVKRIDADSAPNEPVYLLSCDTVTYRVVLIPDQAAIITRADVPEGK
jgi:hypothetical protein